MRQKKLVRIDVTGRALQLALVVYAALWRIQRDRATKQVLARIMDEVPGGGWRD